MQPSNVTTITSQYFSPALSSAPSPSSGMLLANNLGMVVTDADDINQCIDIIFHTPLGCDPHRPNFGSDLEQYIDWPLSAARPRIAREVQRALGLWEPRINVLQVRAQSTSIAQLLVPITWQLAANYAATPVVTNLAFGKLAP